MTKKEMIALVFAGNPSEGLGLLTTGEGKACAAFGGKYRIIDFALSNCINSGIDTVGVLLRRGAKRLKKHLGIGVPWDLDRSYGGITLLTPEGQDGDWFSGSADALYQNMDYIDSYEPEYVLVLRGDYVYKMDFDDMLNYHKDHRASVTAAYKRAGDYDKPLGIYIITWSVLKQVLIRMKDVENCDLEQHILPECRLLGETIASYAYIGYLKDVDNLGDYWSANMDLTDILPEFNLYEDFWKIYTNNDDLSPMLVGDKGFVERSLVCGNTDVDGVVTGSVIGAGVSIGEGAEVRDSIIMKNTVIGEGCRINRAIIGEGVNIGPDCVIGTGNWDTNETDPDVYRFGMALIGSDSVIPAGVQIGFNTAVSGVTDYEDYSDRVLQSGQTLIKAGDTV